MYEGGAILHSYIFVHLTLLPPTVHVRGGVAVVGESAIPEAAASCRPQNSALWSCQFLRNCKLKMPFCSCK